MTNRRESLKGVLSWSAEVLIMTAVCASLCDFEAKAAPVVSEISEIHVVRYLSHYGYLPSVAPNSRGIIPEETLSKAIREFQSFVGIDVTGKMDDETSRVMSLPRCDVKDIVKPITKPRSKRYVLAGKMWPKKDLTYRISKYSEKLNNADVDEVIARAFALWSEHTNLTFSTVSGKADIDIRFERGKHGDGHPFDGPGYANLLFNELAHASPPDPLNGTIVHFDDDEKWAIGSDDGENLFPVATHEFGHALGLEHSRVKGSVMFAFYEKQEVVELHKDDIEGIQALYGSRTTEAVPHLCGDVQIDALVISNKNEQYAFRGKYNWKISNRAIVAGYPKLIAETWSGLPDNIDFALAKEGKMYFFKDSKFWVYVDGRMTGDYPKEISEGGYPTYYTTIDHIDIINSTMLRKDFIETRRRVSRLFLSLDCLYMQP